eukprot:gnl/TRDRNA2_/TRDRNA2_43364_c0_seq1.p1 gnl/TRDRNA2_/TRDRNA2_43364_c0~~gnl/TRDRNA2_/TRDRNA2_43364_c0_seq1.p1  ORF type:complete len:470 (+),score=52.87 gnl/TRDRNA2_/TRDRNA2_43364_c0_seq1:255-1664(+)
MHSVAVISLLTLIIEMKVQVSEESHVSNIRRMLLDRVLNLSPVRSADLDMSLVAKGHRPITSCCACQGCDGCFLKRKSSDGRRLQSSKECCELSAPPSKASEPSPSPLPAQTNSSVAPTIWIPSSMPLTVLDGVLPELLTQGLPVGVELLVADLDSDGRAPRLIALMITHGFFPMTGLGMLVLKIHEARCVLAPSKVRVEKKARRLAKGFHLTVNTAWSAVVRSIQNHTFTNQPDDCWLTDKLANAYKAVNNLHGLDRRGVSFHSVELWHTASGTLVAGEIGYTFGSIYTSCTGFVLKEEYPSCGHVQLGSLGCWLAHSGFSLWDLGMDMPYKRKLGGDMVSRSEWVSLVRSLRSRSAVLQSPQGQSANASSLIALAANTTGKSRQAQRAASSKASRHRPQLRRLRPRAPCQSSSTALASNTTGRSLAGAAASKVSRGESKASKCEKRHRDEASQVEDGAMAVAAKAVA